MLASQCPCRMRVQREGERGNMEASELRLTIESAAQEERAGLAEQPADQQHAQKVLTANQHQCIEGEQAATRKRNRPATANGEAEGLRSNAGRGRQRGWRGKVAKQRADSAAPHSPGGDLWERQVAGEAHVGHDEEVDVRAVRRHEHDRALRMQEQMQDRCTGKDTVRTR